MLFGVSCKAGSLFSDFQTRCCEQGEKRLVRAFAMLTDVGECLFLQFLTICSHRAVKSECRSPASYLNHQRAESILLLWLTPQLGDIQCYEPSNTQQLPILRAVTAVLSL